LKLKYQIVKKKKKHLDMIPSYKITKLYLKKSLQVGNSSIGVNTIALNPNPLLKKYYYWIYHYDMPYNSAQEIFYKDEHKLSLKKALDLMKYLRSNNIPYAYVNLGYHRLGTKIFNYEKLKEKYLDIEFAIAYSKDADEICEEYNNHK